MSIQRYDVVGYGQQDIVRSEKGEFIDFADHCKEIDRLTRELAGAKARAVVDASMVRRALHYCPLDLPSPEKWDWMAKHITQALSARPECPPNGLPSKESSDAE